MVRKNNSNEKSESNALTLRQAKELARRIITHHFDGKPKRIAPQGGGLTNFVFAVSHAEGEFIVRIAPEASKINDYIKEQWAMKRARAEGVPTPEVLEVGNAVVPHPYMISRKSAGREATFHPEHKRIICEMGRCAARINSIKTHGFGGAFDWSHNQLSRNETWSEFLRCELHLEERLQTLERRRMLAAAQIKILRATLEDVEKSSPKPALNHGDIRLKNVLADEEGRITAIIDWEKATSNLAPQWELSLALHDLSIDAQQEFLDGYGLTERCVREIMPLVKAINIINYAPEVERLAKAKDAAHLEQLRTRLGGWLDLYSL